MSHLDSLIGSASADDARDRRSGTDRRHPDHLAAPRAVKMIGELLELHRNVDGTCLACLTFDDATAEWVEEAYPCPTTRLANMIRREVTKR